MARRSEFAESLRALLDDTGLFTRQRWARHLHVTPGAISQWVHDRSVPRPETLWNILHLLSDPTPENAPLVHRFYRMAEKSAEQVSPRAESFGPTVADYLVKPVFETFYEDFERLPGLLKVGFLRLATQLARDIVEMRRNKDLGFDTLDMVDLLREMGTDHMLEVLSSAASAKLGRSIGAEPERVTRAVSPRERLDQMRSRPAVLDELAKLDGRLLWQLLRDGEAEASRNPTSRSEMMPVDAFFPMADKRDRAEVVLWRFGAGEGHVPSFDVQEMIFFLFSGSMVWEFEEGHPVRLEHGGNGLLWIGAAPHPRSTGIPPATVRVGPQGALGLAVFYSDEGVTAEKTLYRILIEHAGWTGEQTRNYWAAWNTIPDCALADQRPVTAAIPRDQDGFEKLLRNSVVERRDQHDVARAAGQLRDVDPEWKPYRHAVLSARLLRFKEMPSDEESQLWLAWHDGAELILPLTGWIQGVSTGLFPDEIERHKLQCEEVHVPDRRRQYAMSAAKARSPLPDILTFPSLTPHGFFGVDGPAHCVLLRIGLQTPRARTDPESRLVDTLTNPATLAGERA